MPVSCGGFWAGVICGVAAVVLSCQTPVPPVASTADPAATTPLSSVPPPAGTVVHVEPLHLVTTGNPDAGGGNGDRIECADTGNPHLRPGAAVPVQHQRRLRVAAVAASGPHVVGGAGRDRGQLIAL